MNEKLDKLNQILSELGSVAVAYSGGVDSTLVLKAAVDLLGDQAVALTAVSASVPDYELREAEAIAHQIGARHVLLESHETEDPRYLANPSNRCYFCKTNAYGLLSQYAHQNGYNFLVDGTNADDAGDHRPGRQAARENGVRSPLLEAGLTKADIRNLACQFKLPNWDKPAAACLSSRIPYGQTINVEMLSQVAQGELALRQLGFKQLRLRHHGQVARIEVNLQDFPAVLAQREAIVEAIKSTGFNYVTLDLAGFRSGSMNETLITHGPQ